EQATDTEIGLDRGRSLAFGEDAPGEPWVERVSGRAGQLHAERAEIFAVVPAEHERGERVAEPERAGERIRGHEAAVGAEPVVRGPRGSDHAELAVRLAVRESEADGRVRGQPAEVHVRARADGEPLDAVVAHEPGAPEPPGEAGRLELPGRIRDTAQPVSQVAELLLGD